MHDDTISIKEALDIIEYHSAKLQRTYFGRIEKERCMEARNNLMAILNVMKNTGADILIFNGYSDISDIYITQPYSKRKRYEVARQLVEMGLELPSIIENPVCEDDYNNNLLLDGHCRTKAYSDTGSKFTPSISVMTFYSGRESPYMRSASVLGFKRIRGLQLIE